MFLKDVLGFNIHEYMNYKQLTYRLGGKEAVQPQNGIPGFILHFPLEPSYGYLRFERNGKIPLGR